MASNFPFFASSEPAKLKPASLFRWLPWHPLSPQPNATFFLHEGGPFFSHPFSFLDQNAFDVFSSAPIDLFLLLCTTPFPPGCPHILNMFFHHYLPFFSLLGVNRFLLSRCKKFVLVFSFLNTLFPVFCMQKRPPPLLLARPNNPPQDGLIVYFSFRCDPVLLIFSCLWGFSHRHPPVFFLRLLIDLSPSYPQFQTAFAAKTFVRPPHVLNRRVPPPPWPTLD